jgi:hypothetical protein
VRSPEERDIGASRAEATGLLAEQPRPASVAHACAQVDDAPAGGQSAIASRRRQRALEQLCSGEHVSEPARRHDVLDGREAGGLHLAATNDHPARHL